MLYKIDFCYTEQYLPTKRHRVLRERRKNGCMYVDIRELSEDEFPVAFIVHDYKSIYDNARTYNDFDGSGDFRMFHEEIRTYGGDLYKPVRVSHGAAISMIFEPLDYVQKQLSRRTTCQTPEDFTEASIVKGSNILQRMEAVQVKAERYVIFDEKVWESSGEPMYLICTFGLGHNHGGTGFFIEDHYNVNISKDNYFNALEREQAIAYGKKIAADRGDTLSIDGMGEKNFIEVRMPEMVRRNPQKEHGDGDEFLNSIENMIRKTDSPMEAGLLALIFALR